MNLQEGQTLINEHLTPLKKNRRYLNLGATIFMYLFAIASLVSLGVNLYFIIKMVGDIEEIKGYLDYYLDNRTVVDEVLVEGGQILGLMNKVVNSPETKFYLEEIEVILTEVLRTINSTQVHRSILQMEKLLDYACDIARCGI